MIEKIVLARHGKTDFNETKRVQDSKRPHLIELGLHQAVLLAQEIKKTNLTFDAIICSDTTRTVETLSIIYPEYKDMNNVKIDSRLQERNHIELFGKTKEEIEDVIGVKFDGRFSWHLYFEGTDKSKLTNKFPNNESIESIRARLMSLFNDLKDKKTILLIGSSVFNQYIIEYFMHGTIGKQKPTLPDGVELDFQTNDELRFIAVDEHMKAKDYSSIKF